MIFREKCLFVDLDYNVMSALHGCHAVNVDLCNNLCSSYSTTFTIRLLSITFSNEIIRSSGVQWGGAE